MTEITSSFPPVDIPSVDLWQFLFDREPHYSKDKVIFELADGSQKHTYASVKSSTAAFGRALRAQWGWQKGDVLCLFSPSCVDSPVVTWGTHWANGVVMPTNPAYSAKELAYQLKDCKCKAIATQLPCLEVVQAAADQAGIPRDRILLIGERTRIATAVHYLDFIGSPTGQALKGPRTPASPSDLAYLVYSSGTTGLPKGVMLTHKNVVAQILQVTATQHDMSSDGSGDGSGRGDTILAMLPFFHIFGLMMLLHHPIHIGIKAIVLPSFTLPLFCETISRHKITYAYVVPPVLLGLSKSPIVSEYDLSSLKTLMSGAAPLSKDLVNDVAKRLKVNVVQGYGLSETSPGIYMQQSAEWSTTMGSVGRLLPSLTTKLLSLTTGQPVPPHTPGELCVRGPNVFPGYLNNPTATAASFTPDGFFRTGDVGYHDARGCFVITDRAKELIKYKGFQVAPAELEGLLVATKGVADAGVVGVWDEGRGTEVPRAFVVKVGGTKEGSVRREIAEMERGVVAYKRLRGGVVFVEVLPRTASGKILRNELRRMVEVEKEAKAKARL